MKENILTTNCKQSLPKKPKQKSLSLGAESEIMALGSPQLRRGAHWMLCNCHKCSYLKELKDCFGLKETTMGVSTPKGNLRISYLSDNELRY